MRVDRRSSCLIAIFAVALTVGLAQPVYAGGAGGSVDCNQDPSNPACTVNVHDPGQPGNTGQGGTGSGPGGGNGDAGGCRYERLPDQAPPPAGKNPGGGWYIRICPLPGGGESQSQAMWLDTPPNVEPATLAQQALSRLRLPLPAIRVNPAPPAAQLVYLPTWLWLEKGSWSTQSATASVPALSVTATARPSKLVFSAGDGSTVSCSGPGTVWTAGMDPNAVSPDCGHTYFRPGSYSLTATVTWQVSWAGGGQTGTVPDLTTTSTITLNVTESQALNSNTQG